MVYTIVFQRCKGLSKDVYPRYNVVDTVHHVRPNLTIYIKVIIIQSHRTECI